MVAVVAATVTAGAPALAQGVQHGLFAHNADKVDGKHAVGAGSSLANAAGKLVAAGTNGRSAPRFMPNGFAGPRAFATVNSEEIDFEAGQQRQGFSAPSRVPSTASTV